MGMLSRVGRTIMKKNSYFLATIFAGAFVTELIVDAGVNKLWEWNNRGVSIDEGLFINDDVGRNYGKILNIDMLMPRNWFVYNKGF